MARKPVKINALRGKRLKTLCDEQGISQAKLSEMINISQQTISKIVNGNANLTEATARRISEVFPGYTFDHLMAFDQELNTYESPLEFEKDWIRSGGGNHPLTNLYVVEARIAIALEKMNENGWNVAVDLVDSLSRIHTFQKEGK